MTSFPRIVDNDRDEITAELDGKEIRGWSYKDGDERRAKMQKAHEFAEGWFQCQKVKAALCEELADALEKIEQRKDMTKLHPDGPLAEDVEQAYSEGVNSGYAEMAGIARAALTKAGRTPK